MKTYTTPQFISNAETTRSALKSNNFTLSACRFLFCYSSYNPTVWTHFYHTTLYLCMILCRTVFFNIIKVLLKQTKNNLWGAKIRARSIIYKGQVSEGSPLSLRMTVLHLSSSCEAVFPCRPEIKYSLLRNIKTRGIHSPSHQIHFHTDCVKYSYRIHFLSVPFELA